MINKIIATAVATAFSFGAYAQQSDGSTKSLIKAEKEFAQSVSRDGAKAAYSTYTTPDALTFSPNPINARTYYSSQADFKSLSWTPVYAKVSRSGDWGFTTGPYEIKKEPIVYGQYLSIWKVVNGKWALALDLATEHNKPLNKTKQEFVEPASFFRPKLVNEKQIEAGRGIIETTEKTLNATLKSYGIAAFAGFLNPDARVLFPGREPVIGKDNAIAFYNQMVSKIALKTTKAEKALGGDLAYTYGIATIDYKADLRESFNYVYIYERQADHNWNIILQIYTPAER
jgi:ketosteroid isomerase-like protein